jgi:hypothetical protein
MEECSPPPRSPEWEKGGLLPLLPCPPEWRNGGVEEWRNETLFLFFLSSALPLFHSFVSPLPHRFSEISSELL